MCPLACPVASSAIRQKVTPGAGSGEIRTPKDWPLPASYARISSARLDHIASCLTSTDQAAVGLVARARVCSGAQLECLLWHEGRLASRARQARRALARLVGWRLLDRLPRRIGGQRAGSRGFLYTLGPAGARLLARQHGGRVRRLNAPGERYLNHALAVGDLYVGLARVCREGRADLLGFEFEPACWTRFPGAWGATLTLKPDAAVKLGIGQYEYAWLAEIDMATESLPTIARKAHRHLYYWRSGTARHTGSGIVPRVLWIAPESRRAAAIETAVKRASHEAGGLFAVTTASQAIHVLTTETRS